MLVQFYSGMTHCQFDLSIDAERKTFLFCRVGSAFTRLDCDKHDVKALTHTLTHTHTNTRMASNAAPLGYPYD
jgi:hypothetical protein